MIHCYIAENPGCTIGDITKDLKISSPQVTRRLLKVLFEQELIRVERGLRGVFNYYTMTKIVKLPEKKARNVRPKERKIHSIFDYA